jgi:hypothetical protein
LSLVWEGKPRLINLRRLLRKKQALRSQDGTL